jgi:hypothetical protein
MQGATDRFSGFDTATETAEAVASHSQPSITLLTLLYTQNVYK